MTFGGSGNIRILVSSLYYIGPRKQKMRWSCLGGQLDGVRFERSLGHFHQQAQVPGPRPVALTRGDLPGASGWDRDGCRWHAVHREWCAAENFCPEQRLITMILCSSARWECSKQSGHPHESDCARGLLPSGNALTVPNRHQLWTLMGAPKTAHYGLAVAHNFKSRAFQGIPT